MRSFEEGTGNSFSIKAPFTDGERTEFMWVSVTELSASTIRGTLGNRPASVRNVKEGDAVAVQFDDLNDWLFMADDLIVGGFRLEILAAASKAAQPPSAEHTRST